MYNSKVLHDAGKKLAEEYFRRWIDAYIEDPEALKLLIAQFSAAYDLILDATRKGGVPTRGDVIRYFGVKAAGLSSLSQQNRVACVASIVQLGLTASTVPAKAAAGPLGWVWYICTILLDALNLSGNCYLAYQDARLEKQLADFEAQIRARRMLGHSHTRTSIETGLTLDLAFKAILDWRSQQPNMRGGLWPVQ
jgi:hypothetical protein